MSKKRVDSGSVNVVGEWWGRWISGAGEGDFAAFQIPGAALVCSLPMDSGQHSRLLSPVSGWGFSIFGIERDVVPTFYQVGLSAFSSASFQFGEKYTNTQKFHPLVTIIICINFCDKQAGSWLFLMLVKTSLGSCEVLVVCDYALFTSILMNF